MHQTDLTSADLVLCAFKRIHDGRVAGVAVGNYLFRPPGEELRFDFGGASALEGGVDRKLEVLPRHAACSKDVALPGCAFKLLHAHAGQLLHVERRFIKLNDVVFAAFRLDALEEIFPGAFLYPAVDISHERIAAELQVVLLSAELLFNLVSRYPGSKADAELNRERLSDRSLSDADGHRHALRTLHMNAAALRF